MVVVWPLMVTIAVSVGLSHQVWSLPLYFNDRAEGCKTPTKGVTIKGHLARSDQSVLQQDYHVSFLEAAEVVDWTPGASYTLRVESSPLLSGPPGAVGVPPPFHLWVYSSLGTLAPASAEAGASAEACSNAAYSIGLTASLHEFVWTAPLEGDGGCAVFSVASARNSSSTIIFNQFIVDKLDSRGTPSCSASTVAALAESGEYDTTQSIGGVVASIAAPAHGTAALTAALAASFAVLAALVSAGL